MSNTRTLSLYSPGLYLGQECLVVSDLYFFLIFILFPSRTKCFPKICSKSSLFLPPPPSPPGRPARSAEREGKQERALQAQAASIPSQLGLSLPGRRCECDSCPPAGGPSPPTLALSAQGICQQVERCSPTFPRPPAFPPLSKHWD